MATRRLVRTTHIDLRRKTLYWAHGSMKNNDLFEILCGELWDTAGMLPSTIQDAVIPEQCIGDGWLREEW